MMELLVVACLLAAPDRCDERSIGLFPQMSALTCMIQGQPHIAAWSARRPELRVARWTCVDPARRQTRA